MQKKTKACLSCKYFRLDDIHSGVCRVEKGRTPYPMKLHGDLCDLWKDCGQQFYIRTGWIKSRLAVEEEGGK